MSVNHFAGTDILLVEDDLTLADLVKSYLNKNKFNVEIAATAAEAKEKLRSNHFALAILDIGLPDNDDFKLCADIRKRYSAPIIICTARNTNSDQIEGLELGADDYIIKPVEPKLLLAKIKALLRRVPSLEVPANKLEFGRLVINYDDNEARLDEKQLLLTSQEFEILWLLATHPGEILSRDYLLKNIRGIDFDGFDRSIDIKISKLRRKLGDDTSNPRIIKTIWGKGYLFVKSNI